MRIFNGFIGYPWRSAGVEDRSSEKLPRSQWLQSGSIASPFLFAKFIDLNNNLRGPNCRSKYPQQETIPRSSAARGHAPNLLQSTWVQRVQGSISRRKETCRHDR